MAITTRAGQTWEKDGRQLEWRRVKRVLGIEMIKVLVLLIGLTLSFGLAAGVTISLAPAYADNVQAKGY